MNFEQPEQDTILQNTVATEIALSQLSQQSLLSLTIDEFYGKNGRCLGSMSMDEFIASIWNTDDNQVNPPPANCDEAAKNKNIAPEPTIPQPIPFSVPPQICKKTVEEVWAQIHKSQPIYDEGNSSLGGNGTLQKQPTLGEMTLEDFLVKAGVVRASSPVFNTFGNIASNVPLGSSYILIGPTGSAVSGGGFEPVQMLPQNNNLVVKDLTATDAVENSQNLGESSEKGTKRIIEGPPDVVIERRQRRMLKNRESAARSRARRQAYTVELEAELSVLKEENEKLKQVLAEDERKRKEEISQRKHTTMAEKRAEKLKKLKRPQSASW